MLVLQRKEGEKISIGDTFCLTVLKISKNKVKLGITADEHITITRMELGGPPLSRQLAARNATNKKEAASGVE